MDGQLPLFEPKPPPDVQIEGAQTPGVEWSERIRFVTERCAGVHARKQGARGREDIEDFRAAAVAKVFDLCRRGKLRCPSGIEAVVRNLSVDVFQRKASRTVKADLFVTGDDIDTFEADGTHEDSIILAQVAEWRPEFIQALDMLDEGASYTEVGLWVVAKWKSMAREKFGDDRESV